MRKVMVGMKSIIGYILLIILIMSVTMIINEFSPDLVERGKEVTNYMREHGTAQGVVGDIQYGDQYTTMTFQNMLGEILTYKIENKYAGALSIIQDSQQDKREIKIYFDQSNNIYDAEYIIK